MSNSAVVSVSVSRIATAIVIASMLVLAPLQPVWAQGTPYVFTRIADDVHHDTGLRGADCVALNDVGTVVVTFFPAGASTKHVWRGNGATFTSVAAGLGGNCASINDLDEIGYLTGGSPTRLVKNSNGVVTTLAAADTMPSLAGGITYLPSLSNAGSAVFQSHGPSIYIGPAGTPVYNGADLSTATTASMNDSHTVAFVAFRTSGGTWGIYLNGGVPLIESGAIVDGAMLSINVVRPVINSSGQVAFVGATMGSPKVFTTSDGASVHVVGTNPIDRIAINDAGTVAYRKGSGGKSGIFSGRPGLIDQKVITQDDPIDGSTLHNAFLWEEALNAHGQIAFLAHLADGRVGVYRADPQWLKSLTFAAKVPACGPRTGKVTLTAPAPPGGLIVRLESGNGAAGVPSTVTVPAGKLTATFGITLTAVTSNSVGDITTTVGAQSLDRTLTVRPISVKLLTLTPNPVTGGTGVSATVTLDCEAAPGDLAVAISSTKPGVAQPGVSSLVFTAGVKALSFDITTSAVPVATTATIKASARGIAKSKKLSVTPPS